MYAKPGTQIHFVLTALASAPSADNSQPWCVRWDAQDLKAYVHSRGGFPVDYHATLLALGAAAENVAQAVKALGLNLDRWHFGAPDQDGCFIAGALNSELDVGPQLETPWLARHTNRLPYQKNRMPAVEALISAHAPTPSSVRSLTGELHQRAASWVKRASEIRFRTEEVHNWFGQSLRFGSAEKNRQQGLHVATLNLPPGGSALLRWTANWTVMDRLNRIGLYKFFAAIEAQGFQEAPCALAIIGPQGPAGAFEAGRTLERVWLAANREGWAAHPFYVVSDLLYRYASGRVAQPYLTVAREIHQDVEAFVGAGNMLHCLLRLGWPKGAAARSGRLPIADIMCDASKGE